MTFKISAIQQAACDCVHCNHVSILYHLQDIISYFPMFRKETIHMTMNVHQSHSADRIWNYRTQLDAFRPLCVVCNISEYRCRTLYHEITIFPFLNVGCPPPRIFETEIFTSHALQWHVHTVSEVSQFFTFFWWNVKIHQIIQYNTKFVKRHVAVASEALANRIIVLSMAYLCLY